MEQRVSLEQRGDYRISRDRSRGRARIRGRIRDRSGAGRRLGPRDF
jgi:hypothetical protein